MKKIIAVSLIVIMVMVVLAGCQTGSSVQSPQEEASDSNKYNDGVYVAIQDAYSRSGWKYHVAITVENGEIIDAVWNALNRVPADDKWTQSVNGTYGMVAFSEAQSEWHEQAQKTIDYLIEMQTPNPGDGFYLEDNSKTDAIAGVTISVSDFFVLADMALSSEPISSGPFTDGTPFVSLDPDDKGWQYMAQFVVVNGTIIDANYNAQSINDVDDAGKPVDKKGLGYDYGMKEIAGSTLEWFEHAALIESYIVENQNFDINYLNERGNTDTIAGVTIAVNQIDSLFSKAFD